MTTKLLIGESQTLSLPASALSTLQLVTENFKAEESNGDIAYNRIFVAETTSELGYTLYGASTIGFKPFAPKYSFAWSLWLNEQKTSLLVAMVNEQERLLSAGVSAPVILTDRRLALTEPVATRSSDGPVIGWPEPSILAYWPIFSIKIELASQPEFWSRYQNANYYKVELIAQEL